MTSLTHRLAEEIGATFDQVAAAVRLLDEGSTIPFIARYRKEATGGLDDQKLRTLADRLTALRALEERRGQIRASIEQQGKLTPELAAALDAADTRTRLEDLYLPYRPKRRTKAQIAREAGLAPLAEQLLADPTRVPTEAAAAFVNPDAGVADPKAALAGARQILVEQAAEDAELVGRLRELVATEGRLVTAVVAGKETEGANFADYFDMAEPFARVPSHRALAMFRGRAAGVLTLEIKPPEDDTDPSPPRGARCGRVIAAHLGIADRGRPADPWLVETARWAWALRLGPHVETDLLGELRDRAEAEAITVFARNLGDLLLAAPAGARATMGLDPGIRTGVKVAVVDATGKLVDTATVYPHPPRRDWDGALAALAALIRRHRVELVSIGNGTASRETDRLVGDLIARHPELGVTKVMVSEAGASVYSASPLAAAELPELDVSLRGAVSIARRLQDPLAELVKIDPKSIGVGQYQHDVAERRLAAALDGVVEDCVNRVGVDLNTASVSLLARVAGVGETVARNIVATRETAGAFANRRQLLKVPKLGPRTFEQAAGFLRIRAGDTPLDASAVHPEAYPVVERILTKTGRPIKQLIGDSRTLATLDPAAFTDDRFGLPTVIDILTELDKPGRDPRPAFRAAKFRDGVETLADLKPGMTLEGVVTNVAAFGAFVDIGVHQDGLVHISRLADRFVKDPHSEVKAGDIVEVKVLAVDPVRKRISLTRRLDDPIDGDDDPGAGPARGSGGRGGDPRRGAAARRPPATDPSAGGGGTLAEAFARARARTDGRSR